jgi:hypothetical protein
MTSANPNLGDLRFLRRVFNVLLYSLVATYSRFGGIKCLHLQSWNAEYEDSSMFIRNVSVLLLKSSNYKYTHREVLSTLIEVRGFPQVRPRKRQDTIRPRHPSNCVSRATWWTTEKSGFDSRDGREALLLSTASRPALGPDQPPIRWLTGALSLGVKRPGRKADFNLVVRL